MSLVIVLSSVFFSYFVPNLFGLFYMKIDYKTDDNTQSEVASTSERRVQTKSEEEIYGYDSKV